MAEPLAHKPAAPRPALIRPAYPTLAAVALWLVFPACNGDPAPSPGGGAPLEFSDASADPVRPDAIDGGAGLDSESEAAGPSEVMATPANPEPGGFGAYPFTVDASPDDVP
jgi:hypothetical protein